MPLTRGLFGTQKIFVRQWPQMQILLERCDWFLPRQPPACGSCIRAGDFCIAAFENAARFHFNISGDRCRQAREKEP